MPDFAIVDSRVHLCDPKRFKYLSSQSDAVTKIVSVEEVLVVSSRLFGATQ